MIFVQTFIGILLIGVGTAEVFTAIADLESLLGAEKEVTAAIDDYISAEKDRLQKLHR